MSSESSVSPRVSELDPWILSTDDPSAVPLYLANGYMGTSLDATAGFVHGSPATPCYIRGAYSDAGPGGVDCLATLPCWNRLHYAVPCRLLDYHRSLDLESGTLRTRFTIEEERGRVQVDHTIFVSRADQHAAAIRLVMVPDFDAPIAVEGGLEVGAPGDVLTEQAGSDGRSVWHVGRTRKYGVTVAECLHFLEPEWEMEVDPVQEGIQVHLKRSCTAGEAVTLTQLVRTATSLDRKEYLRTVREGMTRYEDMQAAHKTAWARLWETDIEIEGDPAVQQFARASLFYLWSSMREGDRWSIAPMGLSSNFYNGHIFWDAELWMYPSLLLTQPDMARSCVAYRESTMEPARKRAASNGHRGTQYPWEAAFTGEEMTPVWAETRDFQLHITADVAIGQWWYYLNTLDRDWLKCHGYPVIRECAEYWSSRVERDAGRDCYVISDVVCADEYAEHVDNDAFTNAAVRQSLLIAARAAELVGEESPPAWTDIAEKIYIPFDSASRHHLEYEGFDGQVTKQADVELLAFPLEYVTDRAQVARDLDYYATVIDPNGPAMSFSAYSVISSQLGRTRDAYDFLQRAYEPNTRLPFYTFSETPENNAYFFCTGAGGALQGLLFGFTGVRLREGYFVLHPQLAPHWNAVRLRGIYLLGARTDIEITRDGTVVTRCVNGESVVLCLPSIDGGEGTGSVQWDEGNDYNVMVRATPEGSESEPSRVEQSSSGATFPISWNAETRVTVKGQDEQTVIDVLLRR